MKGVGKDTERERGREREKRDSATGTPSFAMRSGFKADPIVGLALI